MNFKKEKYLIIKNVINEELTKFCRDYFLLKRNMVKFLMDNNHLSDISTEWGNWKDQQVPNTYSHYSDLVMETLLLKIKPIMEKHTKLKLVETYSYARIYKNGDVLHRHKDRPSCEISTTLNLGGDPWPIYLEKENKEIKINLKHGDMLVYKGCDLEHWRNAFNGEKCIQVFLHYNDINSKFKNTNKFDGRPMLGLPNNFKKI